VFGALLLLSPKLERHPLLPDHAKALADEVLVVCGDNARSHGTCSVGRTGLHAELARRGCVDRGRPADKPRAFSDAGEAVAGRGAVSVGLRPGVDGGRRELVGRVVWGWLGRGRLVVVAACSDVGVQLVEDAERVADVPDLGDLAVLDPVEPLRPWSP
jgi:hypothetical protein